MKKNGVLVRKFGEKKEDPRKGQTRAIRNKKLKKNLIIHTMNNDGRRNNSETYICEALLIKLQNSTKQLFSRRKQQNASKSSVKILNKVIEFIERTIKRAIRYQTIY